MTSFFAPFATGTSKVLALDMQSLFLTGRVLPYGAQLNVIHVFRSSEKSPVEVVYCFPLPRDASLVSFQVSGERFSISSRLEPALEAQKRYEAALEAGSLAAVTQQNQDGLVNLTLGNLRPGETVTVSLNLVAGVSLKDDGFRLRFPFTAAPLYHPQMRVSVEQPGSGTIELPEHITQGLMLPSLHKDASHLHTTGFSLQIEPSPLIAEVASPSHAIKMLLNSGSVGVKLSPDQDVPNRDLVLDVKHNLASGKAWAAPISAGRKHFVAVAPSLVFGRAQQEPRRIVFLLDRSGSMAGLCMTQAQQAIENCLAKLSPDDQFGIVAFDNVAELFRADMTSAHADHQYEASKFLKGINARGGTELAHGIDAAAQLLGSHGGSMMVITDGQVAGTIEILRRARACGIRLFCLGIGSASQDRFLELLARQTGGVCRFMTPSERVDVAASELWAAVGAPVAKDVHLEDVAAGPSSGSSVFAGSPFFSFGDAASDSSALTVAWTGGSLRLPFEDPAGDPDFLIEKLRGAREIADLEATGQLTEAVKNRLLELSTRYGLASSAMSLVAVVQRADDQEGELPKTKIVPLGMPAHTSFRAYFGPAAPVRVMATFARKAAAPAAPRPIISETMSGPRFDGFSGFFKTQSREQPERNAFDHVRDAITSIDGRAKTLVGKDANQRLNDLISELMGYSGANSLTKSQQSALETLIDFLSGDMVDFLNTGQFDSEKWRAIRQNLNLAWPNLATVK